LEGCKINFGEMVMAQMTAQLSELLEKALRLTSQERGLLI